MGQNQTKKWQFGVGAGLDFSGGSPMATSGAITTSLGCASIADQNGNLLFYTDGMTVYNQSHSVMPNGSGLLGVNGDQSAVILKQPGSSNTYYVFTARGGSSGPGLYYSVVDMSLSGGTGSVVTKNVVLSTAGSLGKLTAGKHCNGQDYWVVSQAYGASFISYSLTSGGVSTAVTSTPGLPSVTGTIRLSPNSRKLVASSSFSTGVSGTTDVYLYDFDNTSGKCSVQAHLFNPPGWAVNTAGMSNCPYGVEFSPNGKYVYYWFLSFIVQSSLCDPGQYNYAGIFPADSYTNNPPFKRAFQLGADKKIYIAQPGTNSLSVINNPNLTYSLSSFIPLQQSLGSHTVQWGLPNFPAFYFEERPAPFFTHTAVANSCSALSFTPAEVCSSTGYTIVGHEWNFGDIASGPANTSTLSHPTHSFTAPGTYSVKLVRFYGGCQFFSDTVVQQVQVASPSLSIVHPSAACGSSSATAIVNGGIGQYTYYWSPAMQTTQNALNLAGGTHWVTVYDQGANCVLTASASITVTVLSGGVSIHSVSCHGAPTGSAAVMMAGGSGIYSYTWTGSAFQGSAATSLSAGSYSVSIFDPVSHCTYSVSFGIPQPPTAVSVQVAASANSLCAGQGFHFFAMGSGGTPGYTYQWANGPSLQSYSVVPPGGVHAYSVVVTDANGCAGPPAIVTVTSVAYPQLMVSASGACPGQPVSVSVSGANSYTWLPGNSNSSSFTVMPWAGLVYTVTGSIAGCRSSATVQPVLFPAPTATAASTGPVCAGQSFTLNVSGGNAWQWQGPAGFMSSSQNPVVWPSGTNYSGVYQVTVTDVNSCTVSAATIMQVLQSPTVNITGSFTVCEGSGTKLLATGAGSYTWSTGSNSVSIIAPAAPVNTFAVSGSFDNGCKSSTTVTLVRVECVSVREIMPATAVVILPNPNNGHFTVSSAQSCSMRIYDLVGKLIMTEEIRAGLNALSLPSAAAGLYTVQFSSSTGQTQFRKLVIE